MPIAPLDSRAIGAGVGLHARPCSGVWIERGWELIIDQPPASPVVELVGRCDKRGIDAMLDLAIAINTATFGNVFRR